MKKGERQYKRLPPCPAYDMEGMEGWLARMARRGWLLRKDGIFAGVAFFARGETENVRYRLTAALRSASMWADGGGVPDAEELDLGAKYGWEYVATRGEFYIYRTFDPDARELNTEPEVLAAAVEAVRKRQKSAVFSTFFWAIVYPIFCILFRDWGGFFLVAVSVHTWLFLLTAALLLCPLLSSLRAAVRLGKLQKRLQSGGALTPRAPSKRQAGVYFGRKVAVVLLVLVWVCVTLSRWSAGVLDGDKTPLARYGGALPFATLTDLAGPGAGEYEPTFGTDVRFNYVREWTDWLSPRNIKWAEHAAVTRAGGTVLEGGLYVDYHEAASEWVAAGLMRDYIRRDSRRWRDSPTPMELPPLDTDEARAYVGIFPTVVFRKGNIVVRASFYQTGEGPELTLAEWAGMIAGSVEVGR